MSQDIKLTDNAADYFEKAAQKYYKGEITREAFLLELDAIKQVLILDVDFLISKK